MTCYTPQPVLYEAAQLSVQYAYWVWTHPWLLALSEERKVKVPDEPMANGGPQLQRRAQEGSEDEGLHRVPAVHGLLGDGMPGGILNQPVSIKARSQLSAWQLASSGG